MAKPAWLREVVARAHRTGEVRPHWRIFCWYCGVRTEVKVGGGVALPHTRTVDHVQPIGRGGGGGVKNCVTACFRCNNMKNDCTLSEFRSMVGGGYFWGEVYAPQRIEWSPTAAASDVAFGRWWDSRNTIGRDDWLDAYATAARGARALPFRGGSNLRRHVQVRPPVPASVWVASCACWWCRTVAWFARRWLARQERAR